MPFGVSKQADSEHVISSLEKMEKASQNAARMLADCKVDVIAYGCTSGSFYKGLGFDKKLARHLGEIANGIPVVTTTTAVVDALRALKIERLSIATPYLDAINRKLEDFLQRSGFEVCAIKGLNIASGYDIGLEPVESVYALSREVNRPDAECVFISCTNFRTVRILKKLEQEMQKPVVSSNQATIWGVLRRLNYRRQTEGYGTLLHDYL
jgi:maleate isomerase